MKIRKLASVAVLGMAAVLMVCADVQAQPGGGRGRDGGGRGFGGRGFGGFGFGGPLGLVQRNDVQEELQLTSDQQDQLEQIQEGLREGFANFREMSREEREELFAQQRQRTEEAQAKLKDLLKPDQAKRLTQLELQFALQRVKNDDQLSVLAAYIDQDKLQAAIGEPFEFESRGFGGGGRRDRGGRGAERGDRDAESSDDGDTGGRRRRRGD